MGIFRVAVFWIVSLYVAACLPALAASSGLNIIPTADVLDAGVVSIEAESAGEGTPWGHDCDGCLLVQVGLGRGVEVGVDAEMLNDADLWLNAKWQLWAENGSLPALAVGVQSISSGDRPQFYAAATRSFASTRLHTGPIRLEGNTRWMFGLDHAISDRLVLQADYTTGDENSSSFGVAIALTESLSLTLAGTLGNSSDTSDGHVFNLAWSTALK